MGGTTLNDINDFEIDKINMPYRPLQRGRISFKEAYLFLAFSYAIGLVLSFLLPSPFFLGAIAFVFLSVVYSQPPFSFERSPLLGNINLSLVTVLIPGLSGSLAASIDIFFATDFVLALSFLTLFFLFITFFKDLKDIRGDKLNDKRTFAIYLGPEIARKVGFVGILIFYPLFSYFFSQLMSFGLHFLFFGVLYILFLWFSIKPFDAKNEEGRFSKLRITFFITIITLLIFANA